MTYSLLVARELRSTLTSPERPATPNRRTAEPPRGLLRRVALRIARTALFFATLSVVLVPTRLPTQALEASFGAAERAFLAAAVLGAPIASRRNEGRYEARIAASNAERGRNLFRDPSFSRDGTLACASCHIPEAAFASPRTVQGRNTPTLYGTAALRFLNWDGSSDSLVAQGRGPLTHPLEMGADCAHVGRTLAERYDVESREDDSCFDFLLDVSAYLRRLETPPPTRFDVFAVAARTGTLATLSPTLSQQALRGMALFAGEGRCAQCHTGPNLSNGGFHNVGVPQALEEPAGKAAGRIEGLSRLALNPYRCEDCEESKIVPVGRRTALGAFKTPPLRELTRTAPYAHNGLFVDLDAVVDHYVMAPDAVVGDSELAPAPLDASEKSDIVAFLRSLSSVGGEDRR